LAATIAFLAASPAFSQGGKADARAHFDAGVKFFSKGNYEEALQEFDLALKAKPHWKIRFNIALCHFELKKYVDAATELTMFFDEGGTQIPKKQMDFALKVLEKIRSKVGILMLKGQIEDAAVTLDGTPLEGAQADKEVYCEPGTHTIKIEYLGKVMLEEGIVLKAGAVREIHAAVIGGGGEQTPDMKVTATTTQSKTGDDQEIKESEMVDAIRSMILEEMSLEKKMEKAGKIKKQKTAGWVILSMAAATLAAGAVTGGLVFKEKSDMQDIDDTFDGMEPPDPDRAVKLQGEWDDHHHRAIQYANASNVLLPLGGALAITSIVLLSVSARDEKRLDSERAVILTFDPGSFLIGVTF